MYSTFIAIVSSEGHKTRGVRQAKRRQNTTDYAHHADKTTNSGLICFLGFAANRWRFSLDSWMKSIPSSFSVPSALSVVR
ncbi:MAG: hypothetical protein DME76_00875 [Verrucomicrobia bacterium]|nr:MAG: hypothetical protein DME76_00875 [Verrucomicrobiota bacterium]